MKAEPLGIPEILLIEPSRFADPRGIFAETWNGPRYAEHGIGPEFVQDNHSLSASRGVIRGLHLQIAPNPQGKLVRVVRGAVWDVAVDVRLGSPTLLTGRSSPLADRLRPRLDGRSEPRPST